jgi:hypothetical protein
MPFDTYTRLQAEIANYLARSDLAAEIPSFIALAEAKFNRSLKCVEMDQRATAAVDINSDEPQFLTLPTDYQSMRRVRIASIAGKPRLFFLPSDLLDEKRFAAQDAPGQPRYFTIFGSELELFPTPDAAYTLEMVYRRLIPPLALNASNWLLINHPDAYLYGALMEAEPYMKNDQRIATWAQGVSAAIDAINSASNDAAFNSGPLAVQVSGQVF